MTHKDDDTLKVQCPHCGAELKVDRDSGAVIHSKKVEKREVETFDAALQIEMERQNRHKDLFSQAVEMERKRKELLEKKFQEASREADGSASPPPRLFDLD